MISTLHLQSSVATSHGRKNEPLRSRATFRVRLMLAGVVVFALAQAAQAQTGSYVLTDPPGNGYCVKAGINDLGRIIGPPGCYFELDPSTTLTAPPGYSANSNGINNLGQIVGYLSGSEYHGFIYNQGVFTYLDVPGAQRTYPTGINDKSQIVGYYVDGMGQAHGFLFVNGAFNPFEVPYPVGSNGTHPQDINNPGQIVGTYWTPQGESRGFLFNNGVFTTLYAGILTANGINDWGDIVGTHSHSTSSTVPYVLEQGNLILLTAGDPPLTGPPGHGDAINNRGQVLVDYLGMHADLYRALWTRTPAYEDFNVNSAVTFAPSPASYRTSMDTTGCPGGFVGKFTFTALLTNKSSSPALPLITIHVRTLTNGNVMLDSETNDVLGGAGAVMVVRNAPGYFDRILRAGSAVNVPFVLCLQTRANFQFLVDVYSIVSP